MSADQNKAEITAAMIAGLDALAPLFDTADGMRADMERRGWSPTMAEAIAGNWLNLMLTQTMSGVKNV